MTKTLFLILLIPLSIYSKIIDIDRSVLNANKSNKKILIYLHRTGCSYCNSMEEFTLDDDNVKEFISNYYELVSINISLSDKIIYKNKISDGLSFAKTVGYNFYPTILFLDKNTDIEYHSIGYKDELEFILILNYVKDGYFKKSDLCSYKKEMGYKKDDVEQIVDPRIK